MYAFSEFRTIMSIVAGGSSVSSPVNECSASAEIASFSSVVNGMNGSTVVTRESNEA